MSKQELERALVNEGILLDLEMKWRRIQAGEYVSGEWTIKRKPYEAGYYWDLSKNGECYHIAGALKWAKVYASSNPKLTNMELIKKEFAKGATK